MHPSRYYQQFLATYEYPRELKNPDTRLINFSSNDYLGLAHHPVIIEKAKAFITQYGIGGSSSRSVTGNLAIYKVLEEQLAHALDKPAALILATGFQANISILEALLDKNVLGCEPAIFCDRLCHASILLGMKGKRIHRFQHNDLNHLTLLLEKYTEVKTPKFIVVESLYSMDGDEVDFPKLIAIAKKYNAFLYVDDAHAVGLYGPKGWGKAVAYASQIDIIMGTFSKALGSSGAYIACSEPMRNYLINKCKGLIYSTALSPAILGAISAAIELLPELDLQRTKLKQTADYVRSAFKTLGLNCGQSSTHIIPWIIGDATKTLLASQLLEEEGILGAAIRPPSVPHGQCRIRFCLSTVHSDQDIDHLLSAIQKVERKLSLMHD
jgi:8-amino-7-oxononanoate synthase